MVASSPDTGDGDSRFVAFRIEGLRLALPLACVVRAVRAVAATPLPAAPAIVDGIINLQGRVVPVVSLRRRLGLAEREIGLADQLLIAHSATRMLAMLVDAVTGVIGCETRDVVPVDSVVGGTRHVTGVVKASDGMLLIHDLDRLLSVEEDRGLDAALAATG